MAEQPGSGPLRAQGLGELLDAAFTLYRRNFVLIAAISAALQVPSALLQYGLLRGTTLKDTTDPARIVEVVAFSIAQFLLVQPLIQAAVTRAVSERYLDRVATLRTSYRGALLRLRSLIAMSVELLLVLTLAVIPVLVVGAVTGQPAVVVVLLVLAVLVAVLAVVRISFAASVIVIEATSGWSGLRRSWALTGGSWWRVFGILLLVGLMVGIMSGTINGFLSLPSLGLGATPRAAFMSAAAALTSVFVTPIQLIVVTILYYDLRIRREAFDLEMLAASL